MKVKSLLLTLLVLPSIVFAWQPTKPIEVYVGRTPGSAPELLFRAAAAEVSKNTGATFVIMNKDGAAGVLASDYVSKMPGNGYGVLTLSYTEMFSMDKVAVPSRDIRTYDVDSFVYPAYFANTAFSIIANINDPVSNPQQLVEALKKEKVSISASGGSRLAYEAIYDKVKFPIGDTGVVRVEHKSPKDALVDVMGGHVRFAVIPVSIPFETYKANKVKIVAVSSKIPHASELRTLDEAIPVLDVAAHYGIALPKDTPQEIVQWYTTEFNKALKSDSIKELYKQQLYTADPKLDTASNIMRWMKRNDTRFQPLVDNILKSRE